MANSLKSTAIVFYLLLIHFSKVTVPWTLYPKVYWMASNDAQTLTFDIIFVLFKWAVPS